MKKTYLTSTTLFLASMVATYGALNFGGTTAAPTGSTNYYEGNQKGGPGTPANIGHRNIDGPGGNVTFSISDAPGGATGMTFGDDPLNPLNASSFAIEQNTSSFIVSVDYTGWAIDNNGSWHNLDGSVQGNGSSIRFNMGLRNADQSTFWDSDKGFRITLTAFGADEVTAIDHDVAGLTLAGNQFGSATNDWNISYGAGNSNVVYETDGNYGGDGVQDERVGFIVDKQSGTKGPAGSDFVEVGKVDFLIEFVDHNAGDSDY